MTFLNIVIVFGYIQSVLSRKCTSLFALRSLETEVIWILANSTYPRGYLDSVYLSPAFAFRLLDSKFLIIIVSGFCSRVKRYHTSHLQIPAVVARVK